MKKLIKTQKSVIGFINTTSKRVAAVILAVLIVTTSAVFSVSALREPVIEAIHKFYVNAREILSGTKADKVSKLFPDDVTKIVATSFVSEGNNKYIIEDKEQIESFIKLLSETTWIEPDEYQFLGGINTYWAYELKDSKGNTVLRLDMCNDVDSRKSKVVITKDDKQLRYYVYNKTYAEILAFTNKEYYLHASTLEKPTSDFCEQKYSEVTKGLSEQDAELIADTLRDVHYKMEKFLISNVSVLKEYDSIYWSYVLSDEEFTDPITGFLDKYDVYESVITALSDVENKLKDQDAKKDISRARELWENALINHDLGGLFTAHEYIHDYDYFLFNYPTQYVYDEGADYQGIYDYFGRIE